MAEKISEFLKDMNEYSALGRTSPEKEGRKEEGGKEGRREGMYNSAHYSKTKEHQRQIRQRENADYY
jgi:hypothetical protein